MKIGIDVRKIADYGIGTHIRNVVLPAALLAPTHEFFLYHDPSHPMQKDSRFHWIPEASGKYSIGEHFSLTTKAKQQGIELFHSPHYTLPLLLNCPSVVTIHDLIHLKFQEYFPAWKVQAAKFVMTKAVRKARSIITVSETTRKDLLEWMPDLQPKVRVIYNRLSDDWFQPPPPLDVANLGIASEYLLYVGNFKKHKGIDLLLEAYQQARDLPPLVLVGQGHQADGDLSERILKMANVRLLGFAGPHILRALYSKALMLLFPSRYEGFGYPPLEAMACGCPVLSSNAPAMKEVLGDCVEFFESGKVDDLSMKLRSVLSDSERRTRLVRAGLARAKKFATDESSLKLVREWE